MSRRVRSLARVGLVAALISGVTATARAQQPIAGPNINMVRGTKGVLGDPYLQRQNEPTIAVSSRNPCHLFAGANDYRTVDIPDTGLLPNDLTPTTAPPAGPAAKDAWLGWFKSFDCGASWRSGLVPGYPQDGSAQGLASPLKGLAAGADSTVRSGTNGLFFYSGMVFNRGDNGASRIFISRYIDDNNNERGDTIRYLGAITIETGTKGQFSDKPWLAVDIPRNGYGPAALPWTVSATGDHQNTNSSEKDGAGYCDIPADPANGIPAQHFAAGNVYMAWTRFEGGGTPNPAKIMFARSTDCGVSWNAKPISNNQKTSQGAALAIAPSDGTIYITWREFGKLSRDHAIWITRSTDGGKTFEKPRPVATPINPYDQPKSETRFRTNTLPTIAVDHLGRVYVAWAERGYATSSGRLDPVTGDARIVLSVSTDGANTFKTRYPIADRKPTGSHQIMPALRFTAGQLQMLFYDFADDVSRSPAQYVDDAGNTIRHTVDVAAATASPADHPMFQDVLVTPEGTNPKISEYRTLKNNVTGKLEQAQWNPPNLPLYVDGSTPFLGDYIDIGGLDFIPIRQGTTDVWQPNLGAINFTGGSLQSSSSTGFPLLPVFHATWTDHRDVKPPLDGNWKNYVPPGQAGAFCEPAKAGMRNANIYTSRLTTGLYVGSPGNTKPLGFTTIKGRFQHIQRGFVVFLQNTTKVKEPKRFLVHIANQPGTVFGDRASFSQNPRPPYLPGTVLPAPETWRVVSVPPLSTIARTVYVTATNPNAQVRVEVAEIAASTPMSTPLEGSESELATRGPALAPNGLRTSVLLNPDSTNPPITDPDFVSDTLPSVTGQEEHDPAIFDPLVTSINNVKTSLLEIRTPDEGNPDEGNQVETPDEGNPDEGNPDEGNPDEGNPDEGNSGLLNTALGDSGNSNPNFATTSITDVQWKVSSKGNTTSAFKFRPTFKGSRTGKRFQLFVTRRYYVPAIDPITCELIVHRSNQVLVNVSDYKPRNPDEGNPDEGNPDEGNPDEGNPDEGNPDEGNATFMLAPGETATVTLRVYDTTTPEPAPTVVQEIRKQSAGLMTALATDTTEAKPSSAASGSDLVILNTLATDNPGTPRLSQTAIAPGGTLTLFWTLKNRGTAATLASESPFNNRFVLRDTTGVAPDRDLAVTPFTGVVAFDNPATPAVEGEVALTQSLTIPRNVPPGSYVVVIVADSGNLVLEADDFNNTDSVPLSVAFTLTFSAQPSQTTQDFTTTPAVGVLVLDGVGAAVGGAEVPQVTVALSGGAATLAGTLTRPNTGGVAAFDDLHVNNTGSTYRLGASALGSFAALSNLFTITVDAPPVSQGDSYQSNEEQTLTTGNNDGEPPGVLDNDTDEIRSGPGQPPAGRQLTAVLVTGPAHAASFALQPNGRFAYTPAANYVGPDSFTYRANDGRSDGNTVAVSIVMNSVNDPPTGINDSLSSVAEDSGPRSIAFASLLANDSAGPNEGGQILTITAVGSAVGGTVNISGTNVTFTPTANYNGPVSFVYTLQDNGTTGGENNFLTATATASFTITEVNDAPTGTADALSSVPPNSGPRTISFASLLANDVAGPANESGQQLTITAVGSAVGGAVNITGTNVIFTPATNYNGPASFVYTLRDDGTTAGANAFLTATAAVSFAITTSAPPTTTPDTVLTVTDFPMTTNPSANDLDPDVAAPEVRTTYVPFAGPTALVTFPGEVAVISSTNRAYFTGGNLSSATSGRIGIVDTTNNTLIGATQMTGNFAASLTRVNQSTQIAYMRGGTNLLAVDGRTGSPTLNQVILNINLGSIQSMAIDETHKRLYVSAITFNNGNINTGRVSVVDIDPVSPSFHTVITDVPTPGNPGSIGVNPATNKVYVSVSASTSTASSGLYVLDGSTFSLTQMSDMVALGISAIAVNDLDNVVYAIGGSTLFAIDGASDTRVRDLLLPGSASVGGVDTRLAIHRVTGRVYVRLFGGLNQSDLVVVDGKVPASASILTTLTGLGRETGTTSLFVDEGANRLVTTSPSDFMTVVINTVDNAIVGTVIANQPLGRATIDRVSHRAYASGGVGYIQVVNLNTGALVTNVPVGVELFGTLVDPATHTAFVPQTGTTAEIKIINETGAIGSIPLAHSAGRQVFMARNSVTNRIYALNSASNVAGTSDALPGFVSVIDGTSHAVLQNIPMGAFPFGIAVDEWNNKIYVGNSSALGFNGGISIIDGATNAVTTANLSALPLGAPNVSPVVGRDMVVTSNGKLYFRVSTGGSVQFLGVLNGTVGTAFPGLGLNNNFNLSMLKYNPVLNRLYVGATSATTGDHQVFVINPVTDQIVATIAVGSPSTFIPIQSYIAVNSATGRVYVADFDDFELVAIDGNTNTVVATIIMPFGPSTVAVDEVRNRVYVGSAQQRSLTIIDGATMRVARNVALPITPVRLEVDAGLTPARIYALATATEGAISVIDDPGTAAPQITSVTQAAHGTVVLNADGSVTYTSNSGYAGSDSYNYSISGAGGGTTTGTANVTVYPEFGISTASLGNGQVGQNYSQTLHTIGGTGAPSIWSINQGLPGGLHFTSDGVLSGRFSQPGTFFVSVSARDSGQPLLDDSHTFTINVGPSYITPTSLSSGAVNTPYSAQLFSNGAAGAVTWSLDTSGNPALSWLSISNAGVLSGTPPSYGTTPPFTVTMNDPSSTPTAATRTFTIFVGGPLTMADLREGIVLETEPNVSILGGNGRGGLTTVSGSAVMSGALPPGITLGGTGVFTGTPTRHGTYNFTLELRDCENNSCSAGTTPQTVTKNVAWRVSPKDQLGGSQGSGAAVLSFGGASGRKLAQVFTVGAQGTLNAIGFGVMTCPVTQTTVRIDVQRLTDDGLPDGNTIAAGSARSLFGAIALTPQVPVAIGEKLAFVASIDGPLSCTIPNAATFDSYNAGDAYSKTTGNWTRLVNTPDAVYDIPSFRTLITPAMDVTYLQASRGALTMTLLTTGPNAGKVLIAGGTNNFHSAELYDPATNTTSLTGEMAIARFNAAATMLGDGTVLITGGHDENNNKNAWAEIYNPIDGTFTRTNGDMFNSRDNHRAVRFVVAGVEKVLITGGVNPLGSNLAAPEIYDPVSKTFTLIGNELNGRQSHIAVPLTTGPNAGKILLAGGYTNSGASAELFNPATNTFSFTGAMVVSNRGAAAGAMLSDGRVLITGGQSGDIRNEAEIYDPATNTFASAGIMASKRYNHTATTLADGSVLIAGGYAEQSLSSYTLPLATMERYIPGTGFVPAASMEARRASHAAVTLGNGKVLIAGGFSQSWMTGNTGELFDSAAAPYFTPATPPNGTPGTPYAHVYNGQGGTGGPYTFAFVGKLPPGLSFNPGGTIAGTPTTTGLYQFAIAVTDNGAHTNVQSQTLLIGTVNTITSPYRLAPDASQGYQFTRQLIATGTNTVWSLLPAASNLPPGITLSTSGLLDGIPTTTGYYNFGVRAVDNNGLGTEATKILSISVSSPLVFTTTAVPVGAVLEFYSYCLNASGGAGSRTFDITGGAVPGVSLLPSGCFTNPPTALGDFPITARVTDQGTGQTISRNFTVRVAARDQSGSSQSSAAISFGGPGGRRLAQTVTAGANGLLIAVGSFNLSCSAASVEIQGVRPDGLPNGTTVATGGFQSNAGSSSGIEITPALPMTIGSQFAIVFSSPASCNVNSAPSTFDGYFAGDGYGEVGGAWVPLLQTDSKYDIPVRSLILPDVPVGFLRFSRSSHNATLLNDGRILVTGGSTPERFNPATGDSTLTGNLNTVNRSGFTATRLNDGTVLIAGGQAFLNNVTTYLTQAEIFDPATGSFTVLTSPMNFGRTAHTATLLSDGTVLIAGGFGPSTIRQAEIFNPVSQTFTVVGDMVSFRNSHTATKLQDGRVLIVGGNTSAPAELYDPISHTFSATGSTVEPRSSGFTATLLADGRVLVTGGFGVVTPAVRNSAEIYDPATGAFTITGSMSIPRASHTAVLLADGSVLVSGGRDLSNASRTLSRHERFVPASGTFVPAGGMVTQRSNHTATRLSDGRVVILGGFSNGGTLPGQTAEIYDPATALALTGVPLADAQLLDPYTAGLVASGGSGTGYSIVRVSGSLPPGLTYNSSTFTIGGGGQAPTAAGIYTVGMRITDSLGRTGVEPLTIRVSPLDITTLSLPNPVVNTPYSFTLGATGVDTATWSVFVGALPAGLSLVGNQIVGTPTSQTSTSFTLKVVDSAGQVTKQSFFLAVQLPPTDQQSSWDTSQPALTIGGATRLAQRVMTGITGTLWGVSAPNLMCPAGTVVTAEIQGSLASGAPNGIVLSTGSASATSTFPTIALTPATFFAAEAAFDIVFSTDQACQMFPTSFDSYAGGNGFVFAGSWQTLNAVDGRYDIPFWTYVQPAAGLTTTLRNRGNHTATTLLDGRVLLIGGSDQSADIYDPATGVFTPVGNMNALRYEHRASLLQNGEVLVTGGYNFTGPGNTVAYLASAELFNPATGTFELLSSTMASRRYDHTSTTLQNGDVLIAGGSGTSDGTNFVTWQSAELYMAALQTFVPAGNMQSARSAHTATLLQDGRVLLDRGYSGNRSEIFNPSSTTFVFTTGLPVVSFRARHTATLLSNGTVLIAGGSGSPATTSAEIFNPAGGGSFSNAGNLLKPRVDHTATRLPDGSVLLTGGLDDTGPCCPPIPPQASMERYTGAGFVSAGSMLVSRYVHTASLLPNGQVLLFGTWGWSQLAGRTAESYAPVTAVALVNPKALDGRLNLPYSFTLAGSGGNGGPYTIQHRSGPLPSGLTYDQGTRRIEGSPEELGTFTMTFTVTDTSGNTNSQTVILRIDP